jgi:hypothetical protein
VEVLAYAPTAFFHCTHCEVVFRHVGLGPKIHAEQEAAAFPDDLRQEYALLSDWIRRLVARYGGRVEIKVVDAASLEGFWKALRYGVRRFPALITGGRAYVIDGDLAHAEEVIEKLVTDARGDAGRAATVAV